MQAGDWQIGSVLDSNAFSRDPTPPTRLAAAAMKDDGGENDEAKDGLGCGGGGGGGRGVLAQRGTRFTPSFQFPTAPCFCLVRHVCCFFPPWRVLLLVN